MDTQVVHTPVTTRTITYAEAVRQALQEEMTRDPNVFVMGEDIGSYGGTFKATKGLFAEFGPNRIIDTPLAESALVGVGVGAAWNGMRPVVEIMFGDILTISADQLINNAAKWRYLSNGRDKIPLVVRTAGGGGVGYGAMHSQAVEAWFANVPGLKIVAASTPADVKGLLKSSIRDDNPVLFLEYKTLYFTKGEVPDGEHLVPLGKAAIRREGDDVTIVTWGWMTNTVMKAAQTLSESGISAEVIDLRTLVPLDTETILNSVRKTGCIVVVEEAAKMGGFSAQISALVAEEAITSLEGPIMRVGALQTPVPEDKKMEALYFPDVERIVQAVHKAMG